MNAWSHLPNAAHIDAVLEDAKARPEVWDAAWAVTGFAAWHTAWSAAWDVARRAARDMLLCTTCDAVRDAINTLITWDESAALLDLTPDALRTIIDVADGDVKHQAVLLLPAVIARSTK